MADSRARFGWESDFPSFTEAATVTVRDRLKAFITDASPEQLRAWSDSIPQLQEEIEEILLRHEQAKRYSAILEYELPMESRRPDVILPIGGGLLVLELDAVHLAWGVDFVMDAGRWSTERSLGYQRRKLVRDAFQLKVNVYRVLVTRARDAVVVFVPQLRTLDAP